MKRLLSRELPNKTKSVELSLDEAHHALQVLRLKNGEIVELLDGEGGAILGKLMIHGKKAIAEYHAPAPHTEARNKILPVTLGIGILKTEAMEWVIEKSVELGVESLVPLIVDHAVVETKKKGGKFFRDRWQRSADQALKQCGRLRRLHVEAPIELAGFLNSKLLTDKLTDSGLYLWCDEKAALTGQTLSQTLSRALSTIICEHPTLPHISLLIGPEGGWSSNERLLLGKASAAGGKTFMPITLGPFILRAETAALYSVSVLRVAFEKKSDLTPAHFKGEAH